MMPACCCEKYGCPNGVQQPDGAHEHCHECIVAGCIWDEPCKLRADDEEAAPAEAAS